MQFLSLDSYDDNMPNWSSDDPISNFDNDSDVAYPSYLLSSCMDFDDSASDSLSIDYAIQPVDASTIYSLPNPCDPCNTCNPLSLKSIHGFAAHTVQKQPVSIPHVDKRDNDEYVPDVKELDDNHISTCTTNVKQSKKPAPRSRGHNLGKEIRFRIGQLMIGFKNRYPRKTKKDIASLISKRLAHEYPYICSVLLIFSGITIDIDIKGVLYNKKQNKWEKIPSDYQLDF